MTMRWFVRGFLFIWLMLGSSETRWHGVGAESTAARASQRIQFRVTTVEEKAAQRNVLSEVVIEGPPGTDFDINFRDARFTSRCALPHRFDG